MSHVKVLEMQMKIVDRKENKGEECGNIQNSREKGNKNDEIGSEDRMTDSREGELNIGLMSNDEGVNKKRIKNYREKIIV